MKFSVTIPFLTIMCLIISKVHINQGLEFDFRFRT